MKAIVRLVLVAAAIGTLASPVDASQADFDSLHPFRAGAVSHGVATADFDEDGRLDAAVIDGFGFQILLGDGGGGFGPTTPSFANRPVALVVADMNGDGHADLVAIGDDNLVAPRVTVRLGDGHGAFVTAGDFLVESGSNPIALAVADFDGNGALDVLTLSYGEDGPVLIANRIELFRGDGSGALPLRETIFESEISAFFSVVAGDFDEDGFADFVADGSFFRGDGLGGFTNMPRPGLAGSVVADFDADGHLDAARVGPTTVAISHGDGTGLFGAPLPVSAGNAAVALAPADLDGDGFLDLVVANSEGVGVALTSAPRSFGALRIYWAGNRTQGVATGDLDGDGDADVLAANAGFVAPPYEGSSLTAQMNDGAGALESIRVSLSPSSAAQFAVADFDEDGRLDLALTHRNFDAPETLRGDGSGFFATQNTLFSGADPNGCVASDLDGDGHADLALTDTSGDGLAIFLGDGTGALAAASTLTPGTKPVFVAAADLDADGLEDLLVANKGTAPEAGDGSVALLLGLGAGAFAPPIDLLTGFGFAGIVAADFDEDGALDVGAVSAIESEVDVLLGDGAAGFGPVRSFSWAGDPSRALAAGDFDGDGRVDLAVVENFEDKVFVLTGDGTGAFVSTRVFFQRFLQITSLIAADLDGDGLTDLALAGARTSAGVDYHGIVLVLMAGPALAFEPQPDLSVSILGLTSLAAADWTGDGFPDLVVGYGNVLFLTNRTPRLFACRRGNVNGGAGPVADVLFVNGSPGPGPERRIVIDRADAFTLTIVAPPSKPAGPSRFAAYITLGEATRATRRVLPLGIGESCVPLPPNGGSPKKVANNIGHVRLLGAENWPGPPTSPAPTTLLALPAGIGHAVTLVVQGLIVDSGAPNGRAAVANAIVVESR